MLKIFQSLFQSLHSDKVQFCNWKSHYEVDRFLQGEGDLDLFIPLAEKNNFEEIAIKVGFRKVLSYQGNHDYIDHYYGFDIDSFKFAHIHVYFKIVTGEHISKNYILPLEQYIKDNENHSKILPSANEQAKRSIFLIRYFLKIGSIYGLAQYFREKQKYSLEWNSYKAIEGYDQIDSLNLSSEQLSLLESAYVSSNFFYKLYLSFFIKRKFKSFRRRSYINLILFNLINFFKRLTNKIFLKKKKLLDPGYVAAICGLDGSGKSSVVVALDKNLSKHFSVKMFHLGRPRSNIFTLIFKPFFVSYSYLRRLRITNKNTIIKKEKDNISIIYALRSVLLAYDRKIEAKKAHRYSQKGYLVICDRYPGLLEGKMDSPRIHKDSNRNSLYQFCYRLEQALYKSIKKADMIFHLSVSIEEAIKRNTKRDKFGKETDDELRERYQINSGVTFLSDNYNFIDATVPFNQVLSKVMKDIWIFTDK